MGILVDRVAHGKLRPRVICNGGFGLPPPRPLFLVFWGSLSPRPIPPSVPDGPFVRSWPEHPADPNRWDETSPNDRCTYTCTLVTHTHLCTLKCILICTSSCALIPISLCKPLLSFCFSFWGVSSPQVTPDRQLLCAACSGQGLGRRPR